MTSKTQGTGQGAISLDNGFLNDVGLGAAPGIVKRYMLEHIYAELELRVGLRLTEDMSDEMLDEFGAFVDEDDEKMQSLLDSYFPLDDPKNMETVLHNYNEAVKDNPDLTVDDFMKGFLPEFGAQIWLTQNRPDYPEVVAGVLDEIREDIRKDPAAALRHYLEDTLDAVLGANNVYEDMCGVIEKRGWRYQESDHDASIRLRVSTDGLLADIGIVADPQQGHIRFMAQLPFAARADGSERMAVAVDAVNSWLACGSFDYMAESRAVVFSLCQGFAGSRPSKALLDELLDTCIQAAGHLGEQLLAYDRGYIPLDSLTRRGEEMEDITSLRQMPAKLEKL
jgi:hypothetical protein